MIEVSAKVETKIGESEYQASYQDLCGGLADEPSQPSSPVRNIPQPEYELTLSYKLRLSEYALADAKKILDKIVFQQK